MEGTPIISAQRIMGPNFIGPKEITFFLASLGKKAFDESTIPNIPFTQERLAASAKDYMLVLTIPATKDGWILNISNLREAFGINPDKKEPCFYNQDWYLNEPFIYTSLPLQWQLLKKQVLNESRAVTPENILQSSQIHFPSAMLCTYTFFIQHVNRKEILWEYDFIWCSDHDHNNDRVYVGKYRDVDGINKNGFSIHRHLSLRSCYGSILVEQ